MKFYQLWILRRAVLIIPFLITGIHFNIETTSCATYYVRVKRNSSESQNFLNDYLNLVLSKSKELEEVIYSDILNNLGTLVRPKNTETEAEGEDRKKEFVKAGKTTSSNRSEIRKLEHFRGPFHNVHLAVGGEQSENKFRFRNVTSSGFERFLKDGYLLGYSGNPFGSHKLIARVAELENDQGDKGFDPRKKRSVLHLYNMVMCSTGCSPFSYKGYGCYCGFLGSGFVVDGIDSCCKMHDWCYNSSGCPMFLEYFIPYLWKCYHRQPLCAINPGYYNGPGSCSQRLCECDRQLALCLRKYPCPTSKALCTSSPWRLLQNVLML